MLMALRSGAARVRSPSFHCGCWASVDMKKWQHGIAWLFSSLLFFWIPGYPDIRISGYTMMWTLSADMRPTAKDLLRHQWLRLIPTPGAITNIPAALKAVDREFYIGFLDFPDCPGIDYFEVF